MNNKELKKEDPISSARTAMVEFSQKHFKDKTFKAYILEALAGDFCWEVMRAISALQSTTEKPIGYAYFWGIGKMHLNDKIFESESGCSAEAIRVKSNTVVKALYTTPLSVTALEAENAQLRQLLADAAARLQAHHRVMSSIRVTEEDHYVLAKIETALEGGA